MTDTTANIFPGDPPMPVDGQLGFGGDPEEVAPEEPPQEFDLGPGLRLEERIDTADGEGIEARWEFGRWMLSHVPEGGKKLPDGFLEQLSETTGKSRTELKYRRAFAERYPDRDSLANVLANRSSWHDIVAALPGEKDRSEKREDRAQRAEQTALGLVRELRRKIGELDDDAVRKVAVRLTLAAEDQLASGGWEPEPGSCLVYESRRDGVA
jgi:hypothetical protein